MNDKEVTYEFYHIKGFFLVDGNLDCRFDMLVPSFIDVVEFFRAIDLTEQYDVVKCFPEGIKEI